MRVLLDTHVVLWAASEPERLGDARPLIEDAGNELLVSAASSWEIAIKYGLGRLPLPTGPEHYVPRLLRALGATPLSVDHAHALAVARLPPHHRDPFDRILVAQAHLLRVPIVSSDPMIRRYEVDVVTLG